MEAITNAIINSILWSDGAIMMRRRRDAVHWGNPPGFGVVQSKALHWMASTLHVGDAILVLAKWLAAAHRVPRVAINSSNIDVEDKV